MLASDCLVESRAEGALVPPALSLVIPKSRLNYQPGQNPVEKSFRIVRVTLVHCAKLAKALREVRENSEQ